MLNQRLSALHFLIVVTVLRGGSGSIRLWPAPMLALARLFLDPRPTRIAGPALRAVGVPDTWRGRIRFRWSFCYQRELDVVLRVQAARLSSHWVRSRMNVDGSLPAGGVILLAPHHANQRLGFLMLAQLVEQLGLVADVDPQALLDTAPRRASWTQRLGIARDEFAYLAPLYRRFFGTHLLTPSQALRRGMALLNNGGCLIIAPDYHLPAPGRRPSWMPLFGRIFSIGPGVLWLAQRSGKPIIPFMVVPVGQGWSLWLGEPVAPCEQAIAAALEACIQHAPASWRLWDMWLRQPQTAPEV